MKKNNSLILLLLFLSSSFLLGQNVIQVSEGTNKIDDSLFVAQPGDIIELTTNGGIYYEYFSVLINMPLTIRAAEGLTTKPIIYTDDERGIFTIRDDFTLIGVTLIGSGGEELTDRGITTDSMDVKMGYNLTVDDCYFYDFGGHAIRGGTDTQANKVSITNSVFIKSGDEMIYYKNGKIDPGSVLDFNMENCTFWNSGAEAIYVEDHDNDIATPGPKFSINNLTIHNSTDKSIYPKGIDGATLKNFIVSNDVFDDGIDPCRIYGTSSVAEYLLSYNIDEVSLKDDATVDTTKILHNIDPIYLDMAQGNFTLDPLSPAVGFGEDGTTLGDQRWWPSTASKIEIDGQFGDWAGLEPLEVTENDPAISDSADVKAVWVAIDDEKLSFRWDFYDNANFPSNETSGTYNRNQGWHRIYGTAFGNSDIDKYFRFRSYYGKVDTTTFSRGRWDVKSDSLGYDNDEFDGERFKGIIAWNDEGTSMEMYLLLDSLYYPDTEGNIVDYITKDDSLEFYIKNTDIDVFLPAGPGGKLDPEHGKYKVLLSDYYVGESTVVSVQRNGGDGIAPVEYTLSQNYPNPFNPSTVINFAIPTAGKVSIKVYNIIGQEVATLVNEELNAGNHQVNFNASNFSSAIYFYILQSGNVTISKKMILLK